MKTLQTIYSIVNTRVGDEDTKMIPLGSYIDSAQLLLEEIAREVYVWHHELNFLIATIAPDTAPTQTSINVPIANFNPTEVVTVPDYGRRVFPPANAAAKTISYIPQISEPHSIFIPARYKPYFTERVTRAGFEGYELPYDTVKNQLSGNYGYKLNNEVLGNMAFATRIMSDERMEILFAAPLMEMEEIHVTFTSASPTDIGTIDTTTTVPDYIAPAMIEGLSLHISKILAARGNKVAASMLSLYQTEYSKAKYSCIAYSRTIRDKRSTIVMQPMKWLPEARI